MRPLAFGVLSVVCALSVTLADEVHLTTGRSILGEVVEENDREVVVKTAGGKVTLPRRIVERIEKNDKRLVEPPPRSRPAKEEKTGSPSEGLRFAWPIPSEFTVVETVERGETRVTLEHRLSLKRGRGRELRLRFEESHATAFNGRDLTQVDKATLEKAGLGNMASNYADLRISRQGQLLGIEGAERAVERQLEILRRLGKPEEEIEEVRQAMLSPQFSRLLAARMGQVWEMWAAAWVGFRLAPGESAQGKANIPMGQETVEGTLTFRHHGPVGSGLARLSLESVVAGDQASQELVRFLRRLLQAGRNPLPADFQLERFRRVARVSATLDPATLRPHRISSDMTVQFSLQGEPGFKSRRERHNYEFSWD